MEKDRKKEGRHGEEELWKKKKYKKKKPLALAFTRA